MVARVLVTTALEETWPDKQQPILFLGEWCRLHARKSYWEMLDANVLPYHWDDRVKLHADYKYLSEVYERLLPELGVQLNQIHRVNHETRYWRILIGPWLGFFIQILFDRWSSIQQAVAQERISHTIIQVEGEEQYIPSDMSDFQRLYIEDEWNHQIYSKIIQRCTEISCVESVEKKNSNACMASQQSQVNQTLKSKIKRRMMTGSSFLLQCFIKQDDNVLLSTYLPRLDELKLQRRLGQMPQKWNFPLLKRVPPILKQRQWKMEASNLSEFELLLRALIPEQLPTLYLEGYVYLREQVDALPLPRRPKLIWTSNAQFQNDLFKAWAASKIEQNTTLVIGQYGGHYGVARWSFVEEHDLSICDAYFSWGWNDVKTHKIRAIGQLKAKKPLNVKHAQQPHALLVTTTVPRYSYHMCSMMVARQWEDYFNDQCAFVSYLSSMIREKMLVRLYASDYGWNQKARWLEQFPDINLDEGKQKLDTLICKSRLYIASYNATTYLESFTMNIPTVLYWNPRHWELRDSAVPFYDALARVGILHETPLSAAQHVIAIWDDVAQWWESDAVQDVLTMFKRSYSYINNNLLHDLKSELCDLSI